MNAAFLRATGTKTPSRSADNFSVPDSIRMLRINRVGARKISGDQASGASVFAQTVKQMHKHNVRSVTLRQTWSSNSEILPNPQPRAFSVKFTTEGVDDNGAPYRALFAEIVEELLQKRCHNLFCTTQNDDRDQHLRVLNPGACSDEDLQNIYELGRLVGVAVRCGVQLDLDMPSIWWKRCVGEPITRADLREIDFAFFSTSPGQLLEADPPLRFVVESCDGRTLELVRNS